ncbi:mycothiol synthase [Kineosporiaceae bacterium B12]|nr:mycothiol synthase [Kineococcus rubinsiae]
MDPATDPSAGRTLAVAAGVLPAPLREAVEALAAEASRVDGAAALSEDALLRLRTTSLTSHLLVRDGDELAGYAQLAPTEADAPAAGELLVHPAHRRRGAGRLLLDRVVDVAGPAGALLWSHGDTPGAAALAAAGGWERVRELWRMERPLAGIEGLEVPALPAGVRVRPFVPGADDEAWVALNAAAFATHAEQGRWGVADLRLRQREPWFDPEVLLLAEDTSGPEPRLVGSCWMKVAPAVPGGEPVGELYVLGISPAAAGRGLGRALLVRGLQALLPRGAATPAGTMPVELYVDADNEPATRLYARLGFERVAVDVQYRSPHA